MRMEFPGNGTPWSPFKPAHISHYLDLPLLEGIVGVTCGLSMAGSLFIIITFFCFSELRSLGRQLLVHLSAMDFFTACANLVGVFISFHKRMYDDSIDHQGYHIGCLVQGHIAAFATNSSILWTDALALYLLIVLISKRPKVARYSTYVMYLLCYGAPLGINIALAVDDDIGLDNSTAGWCSIKEKTGSKASFYPFFFGNDVWVMASFVFLPAVYIVMKLYLWRVKYKMKRGEHAPLLSGSHYEKAKVVEWKLMLVPLFFVILRVWSLALDIHIDYRKLSVAPANYWVFYVAAAGDSGQGFANGILWCVLSVAVWQRLCACTTTCGRVMKLFCATCWTKYRAKTLQKFKRQPPVQSLQATSNSTPLHSHVSGELELSQEIERIKY